MSDVADVYETQLKALGEFIRTQRQMANLSLRQFAELTTLSNPYLSQLERGKHQPSLRVLSLIAEALGVSAENLLQHAGAGGGSEAGPTVDTEAAIRADARLSEEQKTALLAVYRAMAGGG